MFHHILCLLPYGIFAVQICITRAEAQNLQTLLYVIIAEDIFKLLIHAFFVFHLGIMCKALIDDFKRNTIINALAHGVTVYIIPV